jgi:hypothetical protein
MRVGLACSKASQISCVGALNCRNSVRQRDRDFYSTHFDTRAGHNANLSALDEENECFLDWCCACNRRKRNGR